MLKKLAILGAVTAGATLALPDPAQAILYNVTGSLEGSVAVNGTLDFNGSTYTSWNLTISGFEDPDDINLNQTFDSSQGSNFTNQFLGGDNLIGNGDSNPTSIAFTCESWTKPLLAFYPSGFWSRWRLRLV